MGHYDGVEESIAAERAENDKIIKPLSPEEFTAAWFQAQLLHEQWKMEQSMKTIKYYHDRYKKLNVEAPDEAVKVLAKRGDDYKYKVTHDPKIRALIRGEDE
jgi:hypothetical protein